VGFGSQARVDRLLLAVFAIERDSCARTRRRDAATAGPNPGNGQPTARVSRLTHVKDEDAEASYEKRSFIDRWLASGERCVDDLEPRHEQA
jgi:hypothetical protein